MIRRTMIELAASVVVIMAAPGCKKSGDGAASENKAVSAETGKAGSGDTAKARTEYQYFVTLWRDADLESPVLEQARKEYAAIR